MDINIEEGADNSINSSDSDLTRLESLLLDIVVDSAVVLVVVAVVVVDVVVDNDSGGWTPPLRCRNVKEAM